ncbi:MAG: glycine--tRNA ligase subunit beta [Nitrospirae bacterium]|nr:glycine--tRNA ligase subunit beta [Nitrospirota bacterium]
MGSAQKKKQTKNKKPAARRVSATAAELLFEIGTEELPYQFVPLALRSLEESAARLLKEQRLTHGALRTLGTPRRLVLVIEALAGHQAATVKEAMGPSKAVAFDAQGQPTKAAIGFAGSQGVTVDDLEIRQTPKGEYLCAVKREAGRPTPTVLADCLPSLIGSLSFPKSMHWNETGMKFARPIRWLLAQYGGKAVNCQAGGVKAGNRTWGHRFIGPAGPARTHGIPVKDFKTYVSTLERHGVFPDQNRRRTMILAQLDSLAKSVRGQVHRDEDLLAQAVQTVEYPHAILGAFNPQYLALPKEILMTSMKEHQGFFSLMQKDGSLLPQFISVTNIKLADMTVIRKGNERVLAARLADAKFFFDEDRKVGLASRAEKLRGVTFHQKLGTLYEKQQRVRQLAERLAVMFALDHETRRDCARAAELCKADLTTGIVGEFPILQGIMGGDYAKHDGESDAVSQAIAEQYLPPSMEGAIPKTLVGKVLSLADRLDTIFAFFHVGLVPSGSEDPFALRRNALAVIRIALEGQLALNLGELAGRASDLLNATVSKPTRPSNDPVGFILERLRYYGRTVDGLRDDVMQAVLKPTPPSQLNLLTLYAKMKALQAITTRPEFDPLIIGFKRAHRIVEKEHWTRDDVEPTLFQHPSEMELYKVLDAARLQTPFAIEQGNYAKALDSLVALKPAIDGFFDGVMVNADDEALRKNRLSLLHAVDRLFMAFGDFSQIVVQGT